MSKEFFCLPEICRAFTIGTLRGDNLCPLLTFSAGCFDIQQIAVHGHAC